PPLNSFLQSFARHGPRTSLSPRFSLESHPVRIGSSPAHLTDSARRSSQRNSFSPHGLDAACLVVLSRTLPMAAHHRCFLCFFHHHRHDGYRRTLFHRPHCCLPIRFADRIAFSLPTSLALLAPLLFRSLFSRTDPFLVRRSALRATHFPYFASALMARLHPYCILMLLFRTLPCP